jgi:RimJ/RimL family protein N-acetyltransferase
MSNLNRRAVLTYATEQQFIQNAYEQPLTNLPLAVDAFDWTKTPTLIGGIGLHGIDLINGTATTGTVLAPEVHGKRYAWHAKMLLLDYAFHLLNLERIQSRIWSFNEASLKYNKRCGYVEVARIPRWRKVGQTYYDEIILMVEYENWLPLWNEYKKQWNPR